MKIIATNSQALLSFLGHACNCSDSRQTSISAFNFVNIVSKDGELSVTGSNGSQTFIRLSDSVGVQAQGDGSLCVDAVKLYQVARTLTKDKPVTLSKIKDKDRAVISSGRSRLQLKTIDSSEYPTIEKLGKTINSFKVNSKDLIKLISNVLYSAGKTDIRHFLNAISLRVKNGYLYAVSSDGHRLTANKLAIDDKDLTMEILLPVNPMQVLSRLNESTENVTISFCDKRVEFQWGGLIYRSSLIDHKYPDISRIIPSSIPSKLVIDREEFIDVLKPLLVLVGNEHTPRVKISLENDQLQIKTSFNNEEDGLGVDYVNAELHGEKLSYWYGVNPKYLMESISHIYTEKIVLGFRSKEESCCITPLGDNSCKAVIMPMRC